jgi:heme a synthase
MTGFQRLCLATCLVVFGLIVLGGVVRATESGLGCPDWPRCHGSFIPQGDKHTLIEYSHRLVASVAGLMIFAIAIWAWRAFRENRAILVPALALVFLVLFQGVLGGITVVNELPAEVSAVHLGIALVLFAVLIVLTAAAFAEGRPMPRLQVSPTLSRLAAAALGLTLVLMVVGSYIAGAGYGLACAGWPLCNEQVVPSVNAFSVQSNFIHRLLALLLGLLLVALLFSAWKERASAPVVLRLASLALVVYIVQAMVGAANAWTNLAELARASHLAVGALLWVVLVVLSIGVHRPHELLGESEARPLPRKPDLARAAQ